MTFRQRAAVLMALILALQGVLHAWCGTAAATPAAMVAAICTAHGVQWVPPEAPEAPSKTSQHDCLACQAGHCGGGLLPPAAAGALLPPAAVGIPGIPGHQRPAGAFARQTPPARGPPAAG